MLTKEEIIGKIEQNKAEIRKLGVKKISLFGSYARGTPTPKSDIDFLVEFEEGRGLFDDYSGLLNLLRDILGKENIDLGEPHLIREELKESILEGEKVEAAI
jgi:uncharacterized protein